MKRFAAAALAAVLSLGVLAGCARPDKNYNQQTPPTERPAPITLKVGQIPVIDMLPFWVAEKEGYFDQFNVKVEMVPFKSANERDAAIISGDIDGMLADLVASSTLLSSGTNVKIVSLSLGATQQEGPMGIVVPPGSKVTSLQDLKGKEIAISTNSVMHFVTEQLLAENGLKPEDVKLTSIPQIPTRLEMILAGQIDAAILPDPLLTNARGKGAIEVASDTKSKQNLSQSVIVFTDKAIADKTDGIKRLLGAYDLAVLAIKTDPNKYKDLLAEKLNMSAELKGIYEIVPFSPVQAPKKEDVERVLTWLSEKKLLQNPVTYEQLVNTELVKK